MTGVTNKEIAKQFYQYMQERNFEALKELCHEDLVFYPQRNNPKYGVQGFIETEKGSFDACPDFNLEAKVVFAEGDEVAVYLEFEGTHTAGEYFGVPATGKHVKNSFMTKLRFINGKVVEKRAHYDRYDVLEQLGMDVDKYVQQYVKESL